MSDRRHTWGLIVDVLDVLERHGYHQADDQHTGRAVGLVGDLARIYEGTQEAPRGAYLVSAPSQPGPSRPAPTAASSAAAIAGTEMPVILSALDEAADHKRDRAETCPDCADQSCGTCQHRLAAARIYDTLAVRLVRAIEAAPPPKPPPQAVAEAAARPGQYRAAAGKEAGQ